MVAASQRERNHPRKGGCARQNRIVGTFVPAAVKTCEAILTAEVVARPLVVRGAVCPRHPAAHLEVARRPARTRSLPRRGEASPSDALPPPDGRGGGGQPRRAVPPRAARRLADRRRHRAVGAVGAGAGQRHRRRFSSGSRPCSTSSTGWPAVARVRGRCGSGGASPRCITSAASTPAARSPERRGCARSPAWRS